MIHYQSEEKENANKEGKRQQKGSARPRKGSHYGMAREVGLMEVSGQNVQRIGATTTPTDRAVGSSCSTDNGADKCRKQPSLFLCPNKQCTAEKTNMSRQIRKDAFNLDALQKEHQRKLAEMFNSKEHYKQRCITSDQLKKTLEDHVNALETSNKQLNDKILSLQNELKDQAAEGTQALKAYEKKAMEAQKAVEATLAQTAQDYRKLQDIYNHQTNRFQVVWREKEEMRLGIVQTKNNFRTEMELVVQENLSLRLELSEKNASLQAASKTESVRQELMREAKELMEDANDRTEAAAEELTAVKRDLQSKIDSLEEQVGKLKEECEIAKSDSEKRKQELAEKEDTIAESFQLLEQMEKKKEQALQAKDHRTEKALETLQLENAKVQQLKEELMLTCANWKSKEEKCCKCMVKEDQSHQLEAALTAASAYSDRIKELEDELALVKEQAKKKEIQQEEAEQPTSTVPSSIASSPCPEQSRIKDSLKVRINLPRSRLLKRRKERRTDSLDSTLSELDSPPTMVVRHSAIDSTADQLMTSKEAPILSPQASTPISTSRSQSQDSTTSIPPRKRYRTGKYKGIVGRILEEKFQENQCLSKEHRDECCKLTKLNENQVNNWFHHRRKHGPLLSPVDTTATTKKQSRSYTLVPYPIRAILHAKFKQNNGELNEKEIEELGQQTKLSPEAVKRWFSIRAPLKKRVETPGSNQASISHKDGYAESVSNTQTEGSNQSEKGPTGNFSCVPGSQISHLNRLVQAVSSWAEKIEQDDQPNSSNAKDEVDSQSPSTSATFDSFAQQPDSILFNASHNSTFSVGETSQTTINPSILNVSPLEQDVVHLQLNNHQEGLRQTGQDEAAQILESHYQASPCRLKSCRLQEMCRLTGLTKKQVREWFKQRRKRDNPVDPLVNAHEGPQFACNNIQSTSFTVDDFLEGIFQRGCVPTIPDGWKKLSEETKVDVATLYQWFNQRFQFHQRAQQKAGRTTQKTMAEAN